jgi:hypothetical protein
MVHRARTRAQARALLLLPGDELRVEYSLSSDRSKFARDLAVQLAGHDGLRKLGVALISATAPDFLLEDTPTAVLVRQVLGAIAEFEKASLVAKSQPWRLKCFAPLVIDASSDYPSRRRCRVLGGLLIAAPGDAWHYSQVSLRDWAPGPVKNDRR